MARASSKGAPSPQDHVDPGAAPRWTATASADHSLDPLRALLAHQLGATQDALHALLRLQTQHARALQAWAQTVDDAVHEAAAARELPGLLAVLLKLTGRQLSLASSQGVEGWSKWLEGEVQWADRLRSEAVTLVQDLQPPEAAAAEREDAAAIVAAWADMQEQWRVTLQRWMASAAQPAAATSH